MKNRLLKNLGIDEDGLIVDEIEGMEYDQNVVDLVFSMSDSERVEKEEGFKKLVEVWYEKGNREEDSEFKKLVDEFEKVEGEWILWSLEYDFNLLCVNNY